MRLDTTAQPPAVGLDPTLLAATAGFDTGTVTAVPDLPGNTGAAVVEAVCGVAERGAAAACTPHGSQRVSCHPGASFSLEDLS